MRPVQNCEDFPAPKDSENLTFSDENSDSVKISDNKKGSMLIDCIPSFDACCSSSEPHLLTHGYLNYLVRDLNVFKKLAEPLGSRLKLWKLLHLDTEIYFFRYRQNEFKEICSQENICYFVMVFALLQRLLDTKTIQLNGLCLLTLQKLAKNCDYT